MTVIMKGKVVSHKLRAKNIDRVNQLREKQCVPKLVIFRVGEDPASVSYEKAAVREMKKSGIESEVYTLPGDTSEERVLEQLEELNQRKDVHGILVMQPFPEGISSYEASIKMDPLKDIDGFSIENLGQMLLPGKDYFVPSTPRAVVHFLEFYGIDLLGKEVVVVGSSAVVGKPLSLLLMNAGATVTVCHIHTKDLQKHTKEADILISATGALGLIKKEHIKEDAVVIDVGFGYDEQGKVRGDVNFDEVSQKASYITPVPGGVGSITTVILAENVIRSAERYRKKWKNS